MKEGEKKQKKKEKKREKETLCPVTGERVKEEKKKKEKRHGINATEKKLFTSFSLLQTSARRDAEEEEERAETSEWTFVSRRGGKRQNRKTGIKTCPPSFSSCSPLSSSSSDFHALASTHGSGRREKELLIQGENKTRRHQERDSSIDVLGLSLSPASIPSKGRLLSCEWSKNEGKKDHLSSSLQRQGERDEENDSDSEDRGTRKEEEEETPRSRRRRRKRDGRERLKGRGSSCQINEEEEEIRGVTQSLHSCVEELEKSPFWITCKHAILTALQDIQTSHSSSSSPSSRPSPSSPLPSSCPSPSPSSPLPSSCPSPSSPLLCSSSLSPPLLSSSSSPSSSYSSSCSLPELRLLCLGLGSPTECSDTLSCRYQLALALLIQKHFSCSSVLASDPAMETSSLDYRILQSVGIEPTPPFSFSSMHTHPFFTHVSPQEIHTKNVSSSSSSPSSSSSSSSSSSTCPQESIERRRSEECIHGEREDEEENKEEFEATRRRRKSPENEERSVDIERELSTKSSAIGKKEDEEEERKREEKRRGRKERILYLFLLPHCDADLYGDLLMEFLQLSPFCSLCLSSYQISSISPDLSVSSESSEEGEEEKRQGLNEHKEQNTSTQKETRSERRRRREEEKEVSSDLKKGKKCLEGSEENEDSMEKKKENEEEEKKKGTTSQQRRYACVCTLKSEPEEEEKKKKKAFSGDVVDRFSERASSFILIGNSFASYAEFRRSRFQPFYLKKDQEKAKEEEEKEERLQVFCHLLRGEKEGGETEKKQKKKKKNKDIHPSRTQESDGEMKKKKNAEDEEKKEKPVFQRRGKEGFFLSLGRPAHMIFYLYKFLKEISLDKSPFSPYIRAFNDLSIMYINPNNSLASSSDFWRDVLSTTHGLTIL
ncbi:srr1 protein [Cystoisospora suis]|uniref:Srr1 protein n=1 Tax=Cystoisospora suis TaxID=483139 RepID=A0A2C6L5Q0_9APIC|nr:srr1 protein [Cystoisospora suis]